MAVRVNTGGTKDFIYGDSEKPKLNENERRELDEAYARARERKRKEKLRRQIIWVVGGLIVVILIGIVIRVYLH